jgi:transposase-like protein
MKQVYFIRRANGTGPIKIGVSAHLDARLRQLCSDYRAEFAILASAEGDCLTERNVHLKFAAHRADVDATRSGASEWFEPVPKLLVFIEKVSATGRIPLTKSEQRQWIFAERYLAGETLKQIGDDYGLTRERVRQVLRKIGVPSLGLRPEHCVKARELTPDEMAAARAYERGALLKDVAARFGVQPHRVYAAAKRLGIPRKQPGDAVRRKDHDLVATTVAALYRRGVSTEEIAKRFGWSHRTYVYHWLKRAGVEPARKPTSGNRRAESIAA